MDKKIILVFIILLSLVVIIGCVYFKMKYDEKKAKEQQYYDEQKERIELFMKYNVKGYKTIHFTKIERNPMDGYDIEGYINNDKDIAFTAGTRFRENFQFDGDITSSAKLEEMYIKKIKSVSQIKKEYKR
ncbi:DUF1433 domain-containing protein [Staphylococcus caledonicus]|uniref:DUF1433 domain-containing protein n=1 Tax=Staphylococcus caledonicus TaxID=2741333 RepID=UPI0018E48FA6|nr:DUF1433 domain-containing protein [Staphylococcus caledonicus]MBI5972102.1 DUF1433 domain-containing protein [Staphylococcus caledonicus]